MQSCFHSFLTCHSNMAVCFLNKTFLLWGISPGTTIISHKNSGNVFTMCIIYRLLWRKIKLEEHFKMLKSGLDEH